MPRQIIAYYDGKFMSHKLWVSIIGKHERHGWRFIEFWPQVKAKLLFACRKCKYDLGRKLGIVYAYENWLLLIERIFWMNTDIKPVEIQLRKSPCSMSALFPIRKIIYFNRLSSWKIIKSQWYKSLQDFHPNVNTYSILLTEYFYGFLRHVKNT